MTSKKGWLSKIFNIVLKCLCIILLIALFILLIFIFILIICFHPLRVPGLPDSQAPHTPPWAFLPIIWEDDVNTGSFTIELIEDYLSQDLPIGCVLIDSPWATAYNSFTPIEEYYPDWVDLVSDIRGSKNVHLMLWITSMVNSYSKKVPNADSSEYFDSHTNLTCGAEITWWLGKGRQIDYLNEDAMAWWQGMQQELYDKAPFDGWKLDGTAVLFSNAWRLPFARCTDGMRTARRQQDLYYREEYLHGQEMSPAFVTLSRSVDIVAPASIPNMRGVAPVDAVQLSWIGDSLHLWSGHRSFQAAVELTLKSSRLGYCQPSSDAGGVRL
eukprot:gnl/Dysnectes_brevis/3155_a3932_620.p1 GENE.gnl/Dysnectes_brevis/3155_a3932_620~~gnl/Dysnectes_brevis/3155_a3932_620.p1  ORF type:complete len:366 (+),score=83.97 gnl/Dysnectes_brevis/3155_a3932_620:119-1099(+)